MPYDNVISRSDAAALVPEDVANEILTKVPEASGALTHLRRGQRMSSKQQRMPVLAALPIAYFVNGDTGLKQTTEVNWANKYLEAEEIACIVPMPDAVLDDASFDIWGEAKPLIIEAIGRTLDAAVFFGVNKPSTWPTHIAGIATGAGNTFTRGTSTVANGGLAEDFNQVFSLIEEDGFDVDGIIANRRLKGRIRSLRTTTGEKNRDDASTSQVWDEPITYPMRGLWPTGTGAVEAIVGDFSQAIIALRQDITFKLLSEAVIQDNTGEIVYNLAQQDMVAMRVVFRAAYQVSNVVNYDQPVEASRSPFGVLVAP